ncbi:MAG: DUF952 domain-containing protein [Robiginitomaculum sp.]|nr:DUF952 domain-containing protein [Robiginitomaculum sp.]
MTNIAQPKLYRLCSLGEWDASQAAGVVLGNADDRRDGFLHLSTAEQIAQTAAKYYTDVSNLHLLGINANSLTASLRWEVSRGGQSFPHVYGDVPLTAVLFARAIPEQAGRYLFPAALFV